MQIWKDQFATVSGPENNCTQATVGEESQEYKRTFSQLSNATQGVAGRTHSLMAGST